MVHRPPAAAPGSLLEMPNYRVLLKASWVRICILTRIQELHCNIRDWETFTHSTQNWTLALYSLNQVHVSVVKPSLTAPDHNPIVSHLWTPHLALCYFIGGATWILHHTKLGLRGDRASHPTPVTYECESQIPHGAHSDISIPAMFLSFPKMPT